MPFYTVTVTHAFVISKSYSCDGKKKQAELTVCLLRILRIKCSDLASTTQLISNIGKSRLGIGPY